MMRDTVPPMESDPYLEETAPLSTRVARAAVSEVSQINPLPRCAQVFGSALPQFTFNRLRTALLRAAGYAIGPGSLVMGPLCVSGDGDWSSLFSIGSETFITGPLRVNLGARVRIGDRVNVGHDVALLTVDHEIGPATRRAGWSKHAPIDIEDGVWIGSRATVLPGVTIGRGSVVAAGALVRRDVPENTLVAGVPARTLRSFDADSE